MKDELVNGQKVDQRRAAMPTVAQFVDWCRQHYGADLVDAQMAVSQAARREYAKVLTEQGAVAAKRWHLANAHRCMFYGQENGRVVGMPSPYGQNL